MLEREADDVIAPAEIELIQVTVFVYQLLREQNIYPAVGVPRLPCCLSECLLREARELELRFAFGGWFFAGGEVPLLVD